MHTRVYPITASLPEPCLLVESTISALSSSQKSKQSNHLACSILKIKIRTERYCHPSIFPIQLCYQAFFDMGTMPKNIGFSGTTFYGSSIIPSAPSQITTLHKTPLPRLCLQRHKGKQYWFMRTREACAPKQ
jgi:hypothetical protein